MWLPVSGMHWIGRRRYPAGRCGCWNYGHSVLELPIGLAGLWDDGQVAHNMIASRYCWPILRQSLRLGFTACSRAVLFTFLPLTDGSTLASVMGMASTFVANQLIC